ncbi:prolyl oligopeptidase family serine peptidase [Chromatiaceae bacterium AAb-1]|nr:prolyl oligopeptidase family serine peptidase [Chromatiaceae bacterium AAb-1]
MSFRWLDVLAYIRCILFYIWLFIGVVSAAVAETTQYQADDSVHFDYQQLMQDIGPGWMRLSPDQQWLILADSNAYPSIHNETSEGRIELLGREFYLDRPLEAGSFLTDTVKLIHISTGHSRELSLPERKIHDIRWAPDSERFALIGFSSKTLDIWRFNISQQQPEHWSNIELSGQLDSPAIVWLPDSQSVVVRRSSMLSTDALGPSVVTLQIADNQSVQTRVYRNTLDTDSARHNFAALLRQQAALLSKNGEVRPLTSELLLESISVSPDGRYLLVQHFADEMQPGIRINRLAREYQVVEIATGKISVLLPKQLTDRLHARQPDAAAEGSRQVQWRPDHPASVIWVESVEQQGHTVAADIRDVVKVFEAPFTGSPVELFKTSWRLHQLYLTEHGRVIYSDFHAGLKQLRYWSLQLNAATRHKALLTQYDYTKRAEFPGELVTLLLPEGRTQLVSNERQDVYFQAEGPHRWGDGPYLIRQGIQTSDQRVVFENNNGKQLRTPIYVRITGSEEWLIVTAETSERAPSLRVHQKNSEEQLIYDWHSDDLLSTPEPVLLEFQRSDGVQLYSQLYLPEKATDDLLPAVIWLYPREYHSHQQQPKPSQQVVFQPIEPLSPLVALLDGYAVVDASQAPIIRQDGREPNDTFLQQQQQNITALINVLAETGRIDTSRLVLMGHSYGAFSALSLLTERTEFRCAIARSGAYNRSLTPLGFQGEKRTLWQAPDLYQQLSPFFNADKIKTPVLLIHGLADENPGTTPLQSEMMFQALQAHQAHVKLLLLNKERHIYRYRETIEQMLIAQSAWFKQCSQVD